MEPGLIAVLALLASVVQVAILRIIDYYFPRGRTAHEDRIEETRAQREERHLKTREDQRKFNKDQDDDYIIREDE